MPNSSQLPKSDARGSFIPAAPFKYNPAERPLEDIEQTFVGRQEVLDRLIAALKEQSDAESLQHYLLLGPRGIGKTTLLLMLQKEIDTDSDLSLGWLPVRFGEEEFFVYTLRDLLALTLDYLAAEGRVEEAKQILDEVESEPDDQISLARAVDGLREISRKQRQRILLLIDNFDQIFPKKTSGIDARALRKLLSTESFLMVIGSSVKVFEEVSAYDEAFFNFFSPVYVDDLDESQIKELLCKLAQRDGNQAFLRQEKAQRDKIRAITFLTGGNPRLVMMLYEILSRQQSQSVVQALRATIDGLTPLFKDVMEGLSRQQAKILDAVMRSDGTATPAAIAEKVRLPLNAVTTQLGRLKTARFLSLEGGGKGRTARYRVRDSMFRTWYQMRYLRPARRRIERFVEFLLAWFSIERILVQANSPRKNLAELLERPPGVDIAPWIARMSGMSPGEALKAGIELISALAARSPDDASRCLAILQESLPDCAANLAFLEPPLKLIANGGEPVLAGLPEEEQNLALRIAKCIRGGEGRPQKGANAFAKRDTR